MSPVNERQFQGRVLQWLAKLLAEASDCPFSKVDQEFEVRVSGVLRRFNDLTVFDREGKPACVVELKLPDRLDGRSPRFLPVVMETQRKADSIGAEYFITWNVNSAVLWKTHVPGRAPEERSLKQYTSIVAIRDSEDLDRPDVERKLQAWLGSFLEEFSRIYTGVTITPPQPLDERFAQTIQAYLEPVLVGMVSSALAQRYRQDKDLAERLRKWAVAEQGWTWDSQSVERTARLACIMLVNKIVFYEAMRKVYPSFLAALAVPTTIATGDEFRERLDGLFQKALEIDYETVFTEELIDNVPFLSDEAVSLWREVVADVERYDFTLLDYEVIGRMVERLIPATERHTLGQYFTPAHVVDLINTFCLRDHDAKALDPGCGAGTFLVRGYARLRHLSKNTVAHEQLLNQLWGIDIARYPAHLSVINLAVRDLRSTSNYPKVLREDFFTVFPNRSEYAFYERAYTLQGMTTKRVKTSVPLFDAVVGNPPYTRQEEMEHLYPGTKDRAHEAIGADWRGLTISRRSSIYAHFFLHGAAFLKEGGYLGLLTHSSWLDVDYGRDIQEFFLKRFRIVAVLEPQVEHWFPVVDVNTAVTILQRCDDRAERDTNTVRFVRMKVPLADLLPDYGGDEERFEALDQLVATVESTTAIEENDTWRIVPVRQSRLWREGLDDSGDYKGSKWGKYLRAPDVFFHILERGGDRLRSVGDVATVRRGYTSGANEFFYVKDITDTLGDAELTALGLTRRRSKHVRLVETESGERHLVEAKYLRPLIKSTRDVKSLRVDPSWVKQHALMVSEEKRALRGTHVLKYIRLGETRVFGTGPRAGIPARKPTCRSRKPWYALDEENTGRFLWFALITDTHAVVHNPQDVLSDKRFYNVRPRLQANEQLLFGLLNSLWTFLCAEFWGRQFAGRGIDSIDITVYEVEQLPILAPESIETGVAQRIEEAVERIAGRPILPVLEEVFQADRRQLDDAVLEAVGFDDAEERGQVLEDLYRAVCERVEIRFERARSGRGRGEYLSRPDVEALAEEIVGQLSPEMHKVFPSSFLPPSYPCREIVLPEGADDHERLTYTRLRVGTKTLDFETSEEADFVYLALWSGARETLRVPTDARLLESATSAFRSHVQELARVLNEIVASTTMDRRLRRRITEAVLQRLSLPSLEIEARVKLV